MSAPVSAGASTVAIVGMAGRFPGAPDLATFWRNLRDGVDSISDLSEEQASLVAADPSYVPARGVLEEADLFDAEFFGIAPREAELLDPQHRVFLECASAALEDAGCDPGRFAGLIGVYAGSGMNTYLLNNLVAEPDLAEAVPGIRLVVANDKDHLPTRVSYKLGLTGPSVNVQTACSTSLVAVHLACQALLAGECDLVLAGGVSIAVPLRAGYKYTEGGILSRDGRCRVFDAAATGTVGGNGAGVVVLQRLDDALDQRACIRALIRGSAINNDGAAKVGYTAPSVKGQTDVIAYAHAVAEVDPESIGYIEAHGTGTPLGDPIEVAALTSAFRQRTTRTQFCGLGSVKSNVGHLDAAAGVAGLIKTVLALQHGQLPPTVHYTQPNPAIEFGRGPFYVSGELTDWPGSRPRRAGVSSFGIGGTNVHLVLEEAPLPPAEDESVTTPQVLVLSARTPEALSATAGRLGTCLREHPEYRLVDVAQTLSLGRRAFPHRRAVVCHDIAGAVCAMEGGDVVAEAVGHAVNVPYVVFMFPGQGAQQPGMGRLAYEREPVFREWFDRCADLLVPHLGLDLREILFGAQLDDSGARLRQTQVAQPALFSVSYALARLLMEWGVRPDALIGHSIGEYVAACLAGTFSLEDALGLVSRRGALMQTIDPGEMMAVPLSFDELRSLLGRTEEGELDVASVNGPRQCVVSGSADRIERFDAVLQQRGLSGIRLDTSHAFHSRMMDPVLGRFGDAVREVSLGRPETPFVSNVTGTWAGQEVADVDYWITHTRQTVRFADGLTTLMARENLVLVEVGPGQTLTDLARRHTDRPDDLVTACPLREPRPGEGREVPLLGTLGTLWTAGVDLDWSQVQPTGDRVPRRVPLPSYPFTRQRYWVEPDGGSARVNGSAKQADVGAWFHVPVWRQTAPSPRSAETQDWLLFSDDAGLSDKLEERQRAVGGTAVRVTVATRYAESADDGFEIDPCDPTHYERMLTTLSERAAGIPPTILHAWGVDSTSGPTPTLNHGLYSLLHVAQALGRVSPDGLRRLISLTTGAHDVSGDEPLVPAKAAAGGALRAIPQELPGLICQSIDVTPPDAPGWNQQLLDQIMTEVTADRRDIDVALRAGRRWVPSFESVRVTDPPLGSGLCPNAGWLIIGGLGGVGLETATMLVRETGARVVLAGRSILPGRERWDAWLREHDKTNPVSQVIAQIRRLEAIGGEVCVVATDVTDEESLRAAVYAAEDRFGQLYGVVFAAGAPKTSHGVTSADHAAWANQLEAKVDGLSTLERVLADRTVDVCLLQSSLSAVLGSAGRPAYAASHAYMDAFVAAHNRTNLDRWRVVDWDNWFTWKESERRPSPGAHFMTPEEGGAALRRALWAVDHDRLVVSTGDLRQRMERWVGPTVGTDPVETTLASSQAPRRGARYEEPRTDAERVLSAIWAQVLGFDRIGIDDNYFDLGGDSVIGISILAKARDAGLLLDPDQLFEHQTVRSLASVASEVPTETTESRSITGPMLLTPMQRSFFEQRMPDHAHFNMTCVIELRERVEIDLLEAALARVVEHHDALRLRFVGETSDVRAFHGGNEAVVLTPCDLTAVPSPQQAREFARWMDDFHRQLDLEHGPLMRLALVERSETEPQELVWVLHHLVADAHSWDILLADLDRAYSQLLDGQPVRLPPKSASYQRWSQVVSEYVNSDQAMTDASYWSGTEPVVPLPVDFHRVENTVGSTRTLRVTLPEDRLASVRRRVRLSPGAGVADVVCAAVALSLSEWAGGPVILDREVDGRYAFPDRIDVARTVGWFTSRYPVRVDAEFGNTASDTGTLGRALASLLAGERQIRHAGIGYTALRLAEGPAVDGTPSPRSEAVFVFLGGKGDEARLSRFTPRLDAEHGETCDRETPREHLLEIVARLERGQLQVDWTYSAGAHRRPTIDAVAQSCLDGLNRFAAGVQTATTRRVVDDFPDAGLSETDLARLLDELAGADTPADDEGSE